MTNLVQREHARIKELIPGCDDYIISVYCLENNASVTTLRVRVEQGTVELRAGRLYKTQAIEMTREEVAARLKHLLPQLVKTHKGESHGYQR